jgi:hypothetical protein
MEGLKLSTIFIPTDPAVTRDFFAGQEWPQNILTILDGLHREDYIRKLIMKEKNFINDRQVIVIENF